MFVWINKATNRCVGFGPHKTSQTGLDNHAIDKDTYSALIQDPNKLRWGKLIQTVEGLEFRIVVPPAFIGLRCKSIPVFFSYEKPESKEDLSLWLDASEQLHVECSFGISNLYLTVCPESVFLPSYCSAITLGIQSVQNLRTLILRKRSAQVFLSNVGSQWTSSLTVQINKGQ